MAGVGSSMALAPDGKRFAFLEVNAVRGEAALMVANTDGTGAQPVAVRRRPAYFGRHGLAWSPDGQTIACFAGNAAFYTPQAFHLVTFHVADGHETMLTKRAWSVYDSIAWLGDGRGLIASASDQFSEGFQIWQIGYPGGAVRRVTNDLANYSQVGVTSSAQTMVAVASETSTGIWSMPAASPARAVPVLSPGVRGIGTLAWDGSGGILYSALAGDSRNIWRIAPDGRVAQLTTGPGFKEEMAVTHDGRYMVYSASGKIWRIDFGGNHPLQLTHGALDVHPCPSPDSRWVFYGSYREWSPAIGGKPAVWKVPIDGGEPVQITQHASSMPQISPDGKLIAYVGFSGDNLAAPSTVDVTPLNGGRPLFNLDIPPQVVQWTPDGKSLIYRKTDHGVANIWRRPMRGGTPTQVTAFNTEEIFDYAVSPEGGLAILRGRSLSDVVLIRNFR